jgi:HTH-type transcriptional regulator / antitoxin HigA
MHLKPINNIKDHEAMLTWIDKQFEKAVKKGTPEGDLLEVALLLVKDYEDKQYPINP